MAKGKSEDVEMELEDEELELEDEELELEDDEELEEDEDEELEEEDDEEEDEEEEEEEEEEDDDDDDDEEEEDDDDDEDEEDEEEEEEDLPEEKSKFPGKKIKPQKSGKGGGVRVNRLEVGGEKTVVPIALKLLLEKLKKFGKIEHKKSITVLFVDNANCVSIVPQHSTNDVTNLWLNKSVKEGNEFSPKLKAQKKMCSFWDPNKRAVRVEVHKDKVDEAIKIVEQFIVWFRANVVSAKPKKKVEKKEKPKAKKKVNKVEKEENPKAKKKVKKTEKKEKPKAKKKAKKGKK